MRLLIHLCSHKQFATTFINFIDLKLMKNLANSNHESLQSVSSILSGLLLILAQIVSWKLRRRRKKWNTCWFRSRFYFNEIVCYFICFPFLEHNKSNEIARSESIIIGHDFEFKWHFITFEHNSQSSSYSFGNRHNR